jgi:hypothetical protein
MKRTLLFLLGIIIACSSFGQGLTASMDRIKLSFSLNENGTPIYSVTFNDNPVIKPSSLGFVFSNDDNFNSDFEISGSDKSSHDDTWQPVLGEVKNIRNHYNQLTVHLKQKNTNRLLDIEFRVFADGVGFRYVFPQQPNLKYFIVTDELTKFVVAGDHKTFWIPGDYDTNEYPYTTSKLSEVNNKALVDKSTDIAVRVAPDSFAVQTPLMMKSDDRLYINIHEAALRNYPAMQLHVDHASLTLSSNLVPDALGNKAYLHAPCNTPWRTIIVSDKAVDMLASKMILNLNDPSVITNTSWIKPMKFVGVWWEMQTGAGTWSYANTADDKDSNGNLRPGGRHSANTANVKRYIDFAAANNIQGVLVEGWNVGWEDWFGTWKENVFDFVTPYPDFDVKGIEEYAHSKGVEMIMHHETSGSATNYERQMDTAYRFMNEFGYHSVKTGYVGKIIPRGEHHDGQWMVNHYERVAQKAAAYQIMVDMHEPMRPTGVQRTYPNWIASEAARGNEYNAFSNGTAPEHETILPFTRLIGGPMDYTPGIFKLKGYNPNVPARQMHSTLAKQLALYVTIYSPLQMAADLPQNYEAHMDAFQFIKDVAVDWDDTKILAAEPGDCVAIARKQKASDNWFVGAVTDENRREIATDFSFLDAGKKYVATVYADADDADWQLNREAYTIKQFIVTNTSHITLKLAAGGGTAISVMPAQPAQLKQLKNL